MTKKDLKEMLYRGVRVNFKNASVGFTNGVYRLIVDGKGIIDRKTFESITFQMNRLGIDFEQEQETVKPASDNPEKMRQMGELIKIQRAVLAGYEYSAHDSFSEVLREASDFLKNK